MTNDVEKGVAILEVLLHPLRYPRSLQKLAMSSLLKTKINYQVIRQSKDTQVWVFFFTAWMF